MIKEIYENKSRETTVDIVQTQIDSVNRKNITRTGIRIYDGKSIGVAGTLGNYDADELEKKAVKALELNIPYACDVSSKHAEKSEIKLSGMKEDNLIAETECILEHLRKEFPDFIFSHKVTISQEETSLKNDRNLDLFHTASIMKIVLLFKEKTSSNIFDGYWGVGTKSYDRNQVFKCIDEVCEGYRKKADLPADGILPVVFSSASDVLFNKFIQDLHGWKIGTKSSLFTGKIGKKAFNEKFSLIQSYHPNDHFGPFFDDEGVVNKDYKVDLIRNGTITAAYTDKKTAQKYGLPLTGSAGASYDGVPAPEVKNLIIPESDKTAKELLNGRKAVYVYMPSGGDYTSVGDFASPVQLAFLFDGEKIIGRLPPLNISSNIFDMFGKGYIGVSKNLITPLSNEHYLVMEMKVAKG